MGSVISSLRNLAYRLRGTEQKRDNEPFVMVTYDPKIEFRNFNHCPKLDCYTNRARRCQALPVPSQPKDRPDVTRPAHEGLKALNVTDKMTVEQLVKQLLSLERQKRSDILTIKILFEWLTSKNLDNGDYPHLRSDFLTVNFQLDMLKRELNTYAAFFSLLCHYANIPCVIIEGHVKSSQYVAGDTLTNELIHEWNAVVVENQWQFVDTCWGSLKEKGVYSQSTWYLFPDPRELIYTHRPSSDKWQLLDAPIPMDRFVRLAVLKEFYFEQKSKNKIALVPESQEKDGYIDAKAGVFKCVFNVDTDTQSRQFSYCIHHLRHPYNVPLWEKTTFMGKFLETLPKRETTQQTANITVRFPDTGDYEVGILFNQRWVVCFRVHVLSISNWAPLFVDLISTDAIQRVRKYRNPTKEIVLIMRAVLLLLGNDIDTWQLIHQHMNTGNVSTFRERIETTDIRKMNPKYTERAREIISEVSPEVLENESSPKDYIAEFEGKQRQQRRRKAIASISEDVAAFAKWVQIIVRLYYSMQCHNEKGQTESDNDLNALTDIEELPEHI